MTLGSDQPHYPGYFTCIADNEIEARKLTSKYLNNKWCGTYESLGEINILDRIPRGLITKEYGLEIFNRSNEMKFTIAVYQTTYGTDLILQETNNSEYTRISEIQTVEFKPLDADVVISSQLIALDALIEKTKTEALNTISGYERKKQELLAIEHK